MDSPIYRLEGVVKARTSPEDFVGPLDLILHLLSKNKMEIQDIQLSLILEQYLAWMNQRRELDLEVASEFVTMASHLVYLKTRMLLALDEAEARGEMEELISTLEAHRSQEAYLAVKEVLPQLVGRYDWGQNLLTREPEPLEPERRYRYEHRAEELLRAMESLVRRQAFRLPPPVALFQGIVGREPYPVAEKARQLLERLWELGRTTLGALFAGSHSRSEVVAAFLAVLELCKARRLAMEGTGMHCTLYPVEGGDPLKLTCEEAQEDGRE